MKKSNKRNMKKTTSKNILGNVFILLLILMLYNIVATNINGSKHIEKTNVTVSSNDTLWSIAKDVCEGKKELNVQNIVLEIKEMNDMKDSTIYVGQTLEVPVY